MATSSRPAPHANVMLPHQSIRARRTVAISRSLRYDQTVPNTPIGTFTQNTARQSHAASTPPSTRPMNCPEMPQIWLIPSAIPRCLAGNASVRIAAELAISMAPPKACPRRHKISQIAPDGPVSGSSDSAMEARVKTTKPML